MKRVLALAGSPRRNGNTDILLNSLLASLEKKGAIIDKVIICQLVFKPCQECNSCFTNGECIQQDDMQQIYPKIWQSDILVLASPIFFVSVSAYAKMLIDRCQCLWARKYILNKHFPEDKRNKRRGIFLSAAGSKNPKIFDGAIKTVKSFFDVCEFIYFDEILMNQVDDLGDIEKFPHVFDKIDKLAISLINN